jgi:hypothetical protein
MKLHETDRHAVDLLMDRGQSSMVREGGPGYAASSGPLTQRVRHVQKLLNLLDELPLEEPPADLMARTLGRVEDSPQGLASVAQASGRADPNRQVM